MRATVAGASGMPAGGAGTSGGGSGGATATSPNSVEHRHRLSSSLSMGEDSPRRRFLRGRNFRDVEKAFHVPAQYRSLNCKTSTLKFVLMIIAFGTLVTLYRSPAVHVADYPPRHLETLHSTLVERRIKEDVAVDSRYISTAEVDWDTVSNIFEKLNDTDQYQGIGLLNFNSSEVKTWKHFLPDVDHVVLQLDHVQKNVTWESLYPEWIDEEEDFKVPTCPLVPKIKFGGKPRIDVLAVKLPCNKSGGWSRDVASLHLQLAAASLASSGKSYHPVRVILITDCLPVPNLFTCKELNFREGNVWLYEPNPHRLRQKSQLPAGSCELSVPLNANQHFHSERPHREAYATILHSAQMYVCGAIVAAQSIRRAGSTRDLVILVDETISKYHRGGLEAAGWKVYTIQRIRNPKAERDAYNEFNYSKFRLWQLTDYDKIIFIDADMLILRNIDFLFQMPEITATGNNGTLFNSGVMVLEPSNCTFQLLMDHINDIVSYNGGDQGYLNEIFTWWHRIPKHMNFLKHFWEGDEEEIKQKKVRLFGSDPPILYVLHYLGTKPWLCFRDYDCNWNVDILQEFASDVAHRTWWKVHDEMPGDLQKYCLLRSKQKAALEWDRRQAEKGNFSDGHWRIVIKDERLTTCFEEFCFWESMLWHWGDKNWTDNATTTAGSTPVGVNVTFQSLASL